MGQDANWDLQNYHYYNPWAWLHGRLYTWDIAAAQIQTYHNPLPDVFFYLMVTVGLQPRIIAFALAVPTGVAAFFLLKLLALLFRDLPAFDRRLAVTLAAVIGLTSAMALGVLGTTMNEWPGTALTVAALWLIVRALARTPRERLPRKVVLGAGLLCGLATGGKFTFGIFAVGLCAAILLRGPWDRLRLRGGVVEAFAFGIAVLAGTALTAGPWMWGLWTHFDSPIFPYGNEWIKSPWWGEYEAMGRPYGPHRLGEWLKFPFTLLAPKPFYVTEVPYVDARIPVLYGLALIAGTAWIGRRIAAHRPGAGRVGGPEGDIAATWRVVGVFWIVAFLLWTAQHSIYRYIVVLEVLSGALIVALLRHLTRPAFFAAAAIILAAILVASTSPPDWWRVDFGRRWFKVSLPKIEKNALVLLVSDGPMSYVLPFFPADARHLGVNNNVNDPARKTLMEEAVARAIREHQGPLYLLAYPAGTGVDALLAHRLLKVTETCVAVHTNMRTSPIELCRAARIQDH